MRLVCTDIGFVGLLGGDVEEVVLADQFLHLRLDVGYLGPGELELVQRHVGLFQIPEKPELLRPEDHQSVALPALPPGSPAHPVDVLLGVVRRVVLDDPVHVGDIEPPGGYVSAEQDAAVSVAVLEECCGSFGLLLLAVDTHYGQVDVVEQLVVELD